MLVTPCWRSASSDDRANGGDARALERLRQLRFEVGFARDFAEPLDLRLTGEGDHVDSASGERADGVCHLLRLCL